MNRYRDQFKKFYTHPGIVLLFALAFVCGCHKQSPPVVTRSFYYWKSDFHLSDSENILLKKLSVNKLYIKFFDVSWESGAGQPVPAADISNSDSMHYSKGMEIVPVIFITNESLKNISEKEVSVLAFKMSKHLEGLLNQFGMDAPGEIQLDCDWSETTRQKYFDLIEEMKKYARWKNTAWSATIRLHQIKFPEKTGVPPVDRGMLMFYNMGDIENEKANNSIFDAEIAKQYINSIDDYPLPLDAGIACYSWGLLFDRQKLLRIFYPLYPENMTDSLFQRNDNIYTAKSNFYFEGSFLVKGNSIRLETMAPDLSLQSAEMLAGHIKNDSLHVILYHLDPVIINNYTYEDFENIYGAFR